MGRGQAGQATIELVALLPCLAPVLAVAWQLALAGDAAWAVTAAARAAARADAVGGDAAAAARAHLPPRLEHGLRVDSSGAAIEVSLAIPAVVPPVHLGRVRASATFPSQEE